MVYVQGTTIKGVSSIDELMETYHKGLSLRHVVETSKFSHEYFLLKLDLIFFSKYLMDFYCFIQK